MPKKKVMITIDEETHEEARRKTDNFSATVTRLLNRWLGELDAKDKKS